jgi:hypothetical protein
MISDPSNIGYSHVYVSKINTLKASDYSKTSDWVRDAANLHLLFNEDCLFYAPQRKACGQRFIEDASGTNMDADVV